MNPSPRLRLPGLLLALLFLSLLPAGTVHAHATPTLQLTELPERAAIGQWLELAPTHDDSLTAGELINDGDLLPPTLNWRRNMREDIALGLSGSIWWLRLNVHNAGPGQFRVLELSRATLGSIGIYSRSASGRWTWREAGAQAASARGDVETPGYGFRLWLPPGNSEHLIRLRSTHALNTPVLLSSENAALRQNQNSAGWFGWALGMLTGTIVALLLLRPRWLSLRLATAFILMQALMILFAMADRGVLGSWWIALPGVQHGLLQLSSLLLQMSYVWLMLIFLHERQALSEEWHSALLALLAVHATLLMLGIVITRHEIFVVLAMLPIVSAGLLAAACRQAMRQRKPGATSLFVASLALLCSHLLLAMSLTPLLPLALEPYQWLLGFHMIYSALVLTAICSQSEPPATCAPAAIRPPVSPPAPARPALTPRPSPDHDSDTLRLPMRVLVVEDNTWVQQVIVGLLRKQGVETITAVTGMEALTLLERETLDLVLMDCDLPELDGLSATQVWRQRERELGRQPLPILAVTAHVSPMQRQQALDAGMDDFLAKPVDMRTLREAMIYWSRPRQQAQGADSGPSEET